MPTPIARWNRARDVWETSQQAICGHLAVYSETFPNSGMTHAGMAYELPTSAPHTDDSASSLLPTPTTRDHKGANQRGDDSCLTGALLPTPSASVANDGEGTETWLARRERVKETAHNGNGMGMPLTIAVQLLPTPSAQLANDSQTHRSGARSNELLLTGLALSIGASIAQPSADGNTSSADQHQHQPSPEPVADSDSRPDSSSGLWDLTPAG